MNNEKSVEEISPHQNREKIYYFRVRFGFFVTMGTSMKMRENFPSTTLFLL